MIGAEHPWLAKWRGLIITESQLSRWMWDVIEYYANIIGLKAAGIRVIGSYISHLGWLTGVTLPQPTPSCTVCWSVPLPGGGHTHFSPSTRRLHMVIVTNSICQCGRWHVVMVVVVVLVVFITGVGLHHTQHTDNRDQQSIPTCLFPVIKFKYYSLSNKKY